MSYALVLLSALETRVVRDAYLGATKAKLESFQYLPFFPLLDAPRTWKISLKTFSGILINFSEMSY